MTLATTAELVDRAVASASAVLAVNVITLEQAEGIVDGAERAGCALILQVSENAIGFHGSLMSPILAACRELAKAASVPVAIHLDHLQDVALAEQGIALAPSLGIGSIMIDAAHLEWQENVSRTAHVAAAAHAAGLWVEAELGVIGGKDGAHAPGVRTDPSEAADFVTMTGVDALAVAVGSSHAMTTRDASLDLGLIARLRDRVPVPLVLHGSSGVTDDALGRAVAAGVRKVNVGTAINVEFTRSVRDGLAADPSVTDPRRFLAPARSAVAETIERLCGVVTETG